MEEEANEEDVAETDRIGFLLSHGLSLKNEEAEDGAKQFMEATISTNIFNSPVPMIGQLNLIKNQFLSPFLSSGYLGNGTKKQKIKVYGQNGCNWIMEPVALLELVFKRACFAWELWIFFSKGLLQSLLPQFWFFYSLPN